MALIDIVKPRLGIFYSEEGKDTEIKQMISGALAFFKGAGWDIKAPCSKPLAVEAIVLYCKMAQSTDPAALTNHPVLISMIAQGRSARP